MKIQFASDLHLEFQHNQEFLKENPLDPLGDILILAGDIIPFTQIDKHKWFFKYVSDHFEAVYWIPGNHEYYYADINERSGVLNEKIKSNVFLVNNLAIFRKDVKLIFSTLWSKISSLNDWYIESNLSDFRVIRNMQRRFSVHDFNLLHRQAMIFLQNELANTHPGMTIVTSHHVPTMLHYPPEFRTSVINEAFAVELYDFIEPSGIDYWIYGHHHRQVPDFEVGITKLVTNQMGYVQHGEHRYFDAGRFIQL